MRGKHLVLILTLGACEPYATPPAVAGDGDTTRRQPPPLDDPQACVDVPPDDSEIARIDSWLDTAVKEVVSCGESVSRSGAVRVALSLRPDGSLERVRALRSTFDDCGAVDCLVQELSAKRAPPTQFERARQLETDVTVAPHEPATRAGNVAWGVQSSRLRCVQPADETAESTTGRLPPERIQSLVRASYPRIQRCYEAGLGRHPRLTGKVTIRFVIDRRGRVATATVFQNELPDCGVTTCVRHEFQGLRFPAPEGGIVTVIYPIMLEPG